jgi:hypothetical protein
MRFALAPRNDEPAMTNMCLHRWCASIPAASHDSAIAIKMFSLRNDGKILKTALRKAMRAGVMLDARE